jgi:hypothetical protein
MHTTARGGSRNPGRQPPPMETAVCIGEGSKFLEDMFPANIG